MDNTDPTSNVSEKQTFEELEIEGLTDSIIIKLEPDKQFSPEQIEKMKKICGYSEYWNGFSADYIVFRDTESIYLFLQERREDIYWHQKDMWEYIRTNLKDQDFRLSDGGHYYISENGNHRFGNQVAEELYIGNGEEYDTRYEIYEMGVGINFEGNQGKRTVPNSDHAAKRYIEEAKEKLIELPSENEIISRLMKVGYNNELKKTFYHNFIKFADTKVTPKRVVDIFESALFEYNEYIDKQPRPTAYMDSLAIIMLSIEEYVATLIDNPESREIACKDAKKLRREYIKTFLEKI